jgi:transposase
MGRLRRRPAGLKNANYYRFSNATGLNERIQALKAGARGFRSFHNFRIGIFCFLGKLDLSLP